MAKKRLILICCVLLAVAAITTILWEGRKLREMNEEATDVPQTPPQAHEAHAPATASNPKQSPNTVANQQAKPEDKRNPALAQQKQFTLADFAKEFPGQWEGVKLPDGTIETLAGGKIPLPSLDEKEALQLARKMAAHFGVEAENVQPSEKASAESMAQKAFRFRQVHNGLPVFQAQLSFFAQLPQGDITLVNFGLKPIEKTVDGPSLASSRAAQEFESTSTDQEKVKRIEGPIYIVEGATAKPAYLAIVKVPGAHFEQEVVIDGNTGKPLHRQPTGQF